MLQLLNKTPFAANMSVLANEQGIDTLFVNIKASFVIGKQWQLAEEQVAPQEADAYHAEPGESSLIASSDTHTGKRASDIVVTGFACAPDQASVTQLQAAVSVGHTQKVVNVFGDRFWERGVMTSPIAFETMPMVYERAYGGTVTLDSGEIAAEARNPVGLGFGADKHLPSEGSPLPNIEDGVELIRKPSDQPCPAGFAPMAPNWQSRAQYAGTYDERWAKTRAPYLPLDFDKKFLNTAHPDLVYDQFLQGGEPIQIAGMHARGAIKTQVPVVRLVCKQNVQGEIKVFQPNIETLWLKPNDLLAHIVWKACIPVGKHINRTKDITVSMVR